MKKLLSNNYVIYGLFTFLGLFFGWLIFHSTHPSELKPDQAIESASETIWTCSMHPQIRLSEPGKCPICGMDLIPLAKTNSPVDANAIHLTKDAVALANVHTSVVTRQKPMKEVRLYGKVQADERLLQSQVAHFPGRIEKLMVNFTGESVQRGQILAEIFSPDLITAQQELLESAKNKRTQADLYEAAREKLRFWKLTDNQIDKIENSGSVQSNFEVVSNTTGIVTAKRVNTGDYVSQGMILYVVTDLSAVWVMFDAYESDLPYLNQGDNISFSLQALPGTVFTGKITFIDPVIDPVTRVSKVRVEISNSQGKLKPEMFASGVVKSTLKDFQNKFVVPRSAVLWTGERSIVYVRQSDSDESIFKIREIVLGPVLGNSYVALTGLSEGEEIVTQGTFSVDAAAQLEGKPSMMNPDGEKLNNGHIHATTTPVAESVHSRQYSEEKEIASTKTVTPATGMIQHATFTVEGNCELCQERIEMAANAVNGVISSSWNSDSRKIHIEYEPKRTSIDVVQKAIAKAGHDTDKFKSSTDVYNNLPECCKYRNEK